jgi:hypothetical protein
MALMLVASMAGASVANASNHLVLYYSTLYYGTPGEMTLTSSASSASISCPFNFADGGSTTVYPWQDPPFYDGNDSAFANDVQQEATISFNSPTGELQSWTGGTDYICNGIYHVNEIQIEVAPYTDYPGPNDAYIVVMAVFGEDL